MFYSIGVFHGGGGEVRTNLGPPKLSACGGGGHDGLGPDSMRPRGGGSFGMKLGGLLDLWVGTKTPQRHFEISRFFDLQLDFDFLTVSLRKWGADIRLRPKIIENRENHNSNFSKLFPNPQTPTLKMWNVQIPIFGRFSFLY